MKTSVVSGLTSFLLLAGVGLVSAQGNVFNYQGRLNFNGQPATGIYSLAFYLYDAPTNGNLLGNVAVASVPVTNGLFATSLGFDPGSFNGADRWLQIAVEPAGGSSFTTLWPRQPILPTPYAIMAGSASNLLGTLPATQLTGAVPVSGLSGTYSNPINLDNSGNNFVGNGSGLINVNALLLDGLAASNFWQTAGNAGTSPSNGNFLGTTDNQPLELRVAGMRALRLEPATNSPNVIGGSVANWVLPGVVGATIAGGGSVNDIGTPGTNFIAAKYAVIGGGDGHTINTNADYGLIGGGRNNLIDAGSVASAVVSGSENSIFQNTDHSVIGGGYFNIIIPYFGSYDTIGGGENNAISGASINGATVSGGNNNQSQNSYATVGGGVNNTASGYAATVAGGGNQLLAVEFPAGVPARPDGAGQGNVASGDFSAIAGGSGNEASGQFSAIGGGQANVAGGMNTAVAGGANNVAGGDNSFVGGGTGNNAGGAGDVLAGGFNNGSGGGNNSTISGGTGNNSSGSSAVIGGGQNNFVTGFYSTIGGGVNNSATNHSGTVAGGTNNFSAGYAASIGGGQDNLASGDWSAVGGGWLNQASGDSATVGGGYGNSATDSATVAGGRGNAASDYVTTVAGGLGNQALTYGSAIGGGLNNTASGYMAAIPGGASNVVSGSYAFAAGFQAQATNDNSFVWSDGSADTESLGTNEFVARAAGGFVLYSSASGTGVSLAPGSGSWSTMSDRNAKNDFTPVNVQDVLAKVAALPLSSWSYRTESGVRHVGPMAQDFYSAFGVGEDNRHIADVDEGGVALAAIQGLARKVESENAALRTENEALVKHNQELEQRLEALEKIVLGQKSN